jgi:tetratricopeptide (TPR) repeat protein
LRVGNKYIIDIAMKTIDFSYFIERYNTGEMDAMEKKWFIKELEGNTVLQKEVELRKRVDESLIKHDLIDLRNKLACLEKIRKEKVTANDGKKSVITRFAASVAVLMLLGITYYMISGGAGNSDKIYKSNFVPYKYSGVPRTQTSNVDISFKSAMDLYTKGDYSAASSALADYLNHNPEKTEAFFIQGVSEMGNNNFNSAINIFRSLCENRSNLYLDHSQWYLALCYIKTENFTLAADELQAIVNSGSYYKSKARKVLRKIK